MRNKITQITLTTTSLIVLLCASLSNQQRLTNTVYDRTRYKTELPVLQTTNFDGITYDRVVTHAELDGSFGIDMDLPQYLIGSNLNSPLDYTIMIWLKFTEPVGSNQDLMQIFKFKQSLGCYVAKSEDIICESTDISEKLIVSTQKIYRNQWFHLTISGRNSDDYSYLNLHSQRKNITISTDTGPYMRLIQNSLSWKVEFGYTEDIYKFTGGMREFVFISAYLPVEDTQKMQNSYLNWDFQILAYYRFASNIHRGRQINEDEFRNQYATLSNGQSLSQYETYDFISNDICFEKAPIEFFLYIDQDNLINDISVSSNVFTSSSDYEYTLSMWLNIDPFTCGTSSSAFSTDGCTLLDFQGVLSAHFSGVNYIYFKIQGTSSSQSINSADLFIPIAQWVNVQFSFSRYSGYEAMTFDPNGRPISRIQYSGSLPQQNSGRVISLFKYYRGFAKDFMFYTQSYALPMINSNSQTSSLLLYYDFQTSDLNGRSISNQASQSRIGSLTLIATPESKYLPWNSPIQSSIFTQIPILDIYDGIACDNEHQTIQFNSDRSYVQSTVKTITSSTVNQMTVEFWLKSQSNFNWAGTLFQMIPMTSQGEYFTVELKSSTITCSPFGKFEQTLTYNTNSVPTRTWTHFFCSFESGKQIDGGLFTSFFQDTYGISLQTNYNTLKQRLPRDGYNIYLGNSKQLTDGVTSISIKEFRLWQIAKRPVDINYLRYKQLDMLGPDVSYLLSYIKLSGIQYVEKNMASYLFDQVDPTVNINDVSYISDSSLTVCPPYTYYVNGMCYSSLVTSMDIQMFPVNFESGLGYLFTYNPSQLVGGTDSTYELNYEWNFDDEIVNELTVGRRNTSNIVVHSDYFVDESKNKVNLIITNKENTFYETTSMEFISQKCSYFKVRDSKDSDSYSSYKVTTRRRGTMDYSFTLELRDLSCNNFEYYDSLIQNINYTIMPNQWQEVQQPKLSFRFKNPSTNNVRNLQASDAQEIYVTMDASQQYKLDPGTDYYISMSLYKTKSDLDAGNTIPVQNVQHTINFGDSTSNDTNWYFQDIDQMFYYEDLIKDEQPSQFVDDTIDFDNLDLFDQTTIGGSNPNIISTNINNGGSTNKITTQIKPVQIRWSNPEKWVIVDINNQGQHINKYGEILNIVPPVNYNEVVPGRTDTVDIDTTQFVPGQFIEIVPPVNPSAFLPGVPVTTPVVSTEGPSGGYGILTPTIGYVRRTGFSLKLVNWVSSSPPLRYELYQVPGGQQSIENINTNDLILIDQGRYLNSSAITFRVTERNPDGPTYFIVQISDSCCTTYLEFYADIYQTASEKPTETSTEGAASISPVQGCLLDTQFTISLSNWGIRRMRYMIFQELENSQLHYLGHGSFTSGANFVFYTDEMNSRGLTNFIVQVTSLTRVVTELKLSASISDCTTVISRTPTVVPSTPRSFVPGVITVPGVIATPEIEIDPTQIVPGVLPSINTPIATPIVTPQRQSLNGRATITPTSGYTSQTQFTIQLSNWRTLNAPMAYFVSQIVTEDPLDLNLISSGNFSQDAEILFYISEPNTDGPTQFLVNIVDASNAQEQVILEALIEDIEIPVTNLKVNHVKGNNKYSRSGLNLISKQVTVNELPISTQVSNIQNDQNQIRKINSILLLSEKIYNKDINQTSLDESQEILFAKQVLIEQIQLSLQNTSLIGGDIVAAINTSMKSLLYLSKAGVNFDDFIFDQILGVVNYLLQSDSQTQYSFLSVKEINQNIFQIISNLIEYQNEDFQLQEIVQNQESIKQLHYYLNQLCGILNNEEQLQLESSHYQIILNQIPSSAPLNKIYEVKQSDSSVQFSKNQLVDKKYQQNDLCLQNIFLKNQQFNNQDLTQQSKSMIDSTLIDMVEKYQVQYLMDIKFKLNSQSLMQNNPQCYQYSKTQKIGEKLSEQYNEFSPCLSYVDQTSSQIECACLIRESIQYMGVFINQNSIQNQTLILINPDQNEEQTSSYVLIWQFIILGMFGLIGMFVVNKFDDIDRRQIYEHKSLNIYLKMFVTYVQDSYEVSFNDYWFNKQNSLQILMQESKSSFGTLITETHPIQSIFTKFDYYNNRITRFSILIIKLSVYSLLCMCYFSTISKDTQLDYTGLVLDASNIGHIIFVIFLGIPIISIISLVMDKLFTQVPKFQVVQKTPKDINDRTISANCEVGNISAIESNNKEPFKKRKYSLKDIAWITTVILAIGANFVVNIIFSRIQTTQQINSIVAYLLGILCYSIAANFYILLVSIAKNNQINSLDMIISKDIKETLQLMRIYREFEENIAQKDTNNFQTLEQFNPNKVCWTNSQGITHLRRDSEIDKNTKNHHSVEKLVQEPLDE